MRDETRVLLQSEAQSLELRAARLSDAADTCLAEAVRLDSEAAALRETATALRADAEARPAVQEIKLTFDSSLLRAEIERFAAVAASASASTFAAERLGRLR